MFSGPLQLTLFAALIAAHLLADFVLQTERDVVRKTRLAVLLKHVAIVAVVGYLLAGDWRRWEIPLALAVTHGLIDRAKQAWFAPASERGFFADQLAHLGVVALLAASVPRLLSFRPFWEGPWQEGYHRLMVVAAGAVAAVWVSGVLVQFVVRPFRDDPGEEGAALERGFERGGLTIGRLERALIFVLVLAGHGGAVGFLAAAKSVFRFGDLADSAERARAEYILIGTLASFLFGLVVAFATRALLGAG